MGSILDPRLGLLLVAGNEASAERIAWASAVWLFCLAAGFALGAGKLLLVVYPVTEFILAAPMALYILVSLTGGAGHLTLTGGGLLTAIGVFTSFTLIPFVLSIVMALQWIKASNNADKS
jgi:hypothetical protein